MNNPGQYPAGWRRSVANENRINEIVHRRLRDGIDNDSKPGPIEFWGFEMKRIDEIVRRRVRDGIDNDSKPGLIEFWGEVFGGVCFCVAMALLIFIAGALS